MDAIKDLSDIIIDELDKKDMYCHIHDNNRVINVYHKYLDIYNDERVCYICNIVIDEKEIVVSSSVEDDYIISLDKLDILIFIRTIDFYKNVAIERDFY